MVGGPRAAGVGNGAPFGSALKGWFGLTLQEERDRERLQHWSYKLDSDEWKLI